MRLIDADALKQHYAWWENEEKELFDSIVDQQRTVPAIPVVELEGSAKDYGISWRTMERLICEYFGCDGEGGRGRE